MALNKLISICLPTYNGAQTLRATLDSMILQIEKMVEPNREYFEIVLTDDDSSDETLLILQEYAAKYDFVRYFINEKNLGMDGNFKKSALNSVGKFVWYSGQDDIFLDGALAKALQIIIAYPDAGLIYFNFLQFDEARQKIVCDSMFQRQAIQAEKIDFAKDLVFNNASEYFSFFNDGPSFLPAIIMKRSFWETTDTADFAGTFFIQYANILLNLNNAKTIAVTKPLIRGLIPAGGWQKNGNKLFSIELGYLKAQKIVHDKRSDIFTTEMYFSKRSRYLKRFFYICLGARMFGYKINQENIKDLKFIFGNKLIMNSYVIPLIYFSTLFPSRFLKALVGVRDVFWRR